MAQWGKPLHCGAHDLLAFRSRRSRVQILAWWLAVQ